MTSERQAQAGDAFESDVIVVERGGEIAAMREETRRLAVVIGLLRQGLVRIRAQQSVTEDTRAVGLRTRVVVATRARAGGLIGWLRLRDAEYAVVHGQPSRIGQIGRTAARYVDPRRRRARGGNPLSVEQGAGSPWESLANPDDLMRMDPERAHTEARRALLQSRAIATLLRSELRLAQGHRLVGQARFTETPDQSLSSGAFVPTEAMVSKLVGRVRIADPKLSRRRAAEMGSQPSVTAAVRFHDMREVAGLERCLYSLQAQTGVDLTTLIMYQGSEEQPLQEIDSLVERVWLAGPRPRVIGVPNPSGVDLAQRS